MKNKKILSIVLALLAALFYGINTPVSKLLLKNVDPTFMASFLYLGAGIGVGILYIFARKNEDKSDRLTKDDLVYTVAMIVLDVLAPIFLMLGIKLASASNASLLGNFEIVTTSLIASLIFKEKISSTLFFAICFISLSSIVLSFESSQAFKISFGSLFVILATLCWGLENNCTRKISDKSTYQIVILKGIFSGLTSFVIALLLDRKFPQIRFIFFALVLGFVSYGLSIFMYVRAQRQLGAAKTSAYYAVAPFVGTFLAFVINGESLNLTYFLGLILMIFGTIFLVYDTLLKEHSHKHTYLVKNAKGAYEMIEYSYSHKHLYFEKNHKHKHENLHIN